MQEANSWPKWSSALRRARPAASTLVLVWNVAGLRGLLRRRPDAIAELVESQRPDVLCLQETKLQDHHVPEVMQALGLRNWTGIWSSSTTRLGHAGVATLCRQPPLSSTTGLRSLGDAASGRVVTTDHGSFRLVNTYVPNSGDGLKNLELRTERWDPALARHVARQGSHAILAGDLNVAPAPEDVYDPVRLARVRAPGFTEEERSNFQKHLVGRGLVDAFRHLHPRVRAYTFYSYRAQMRAKGKGWRLDHFLLSPAVVPALNDCFILDEVEGSDHLPVGLVLQTP